jgi:hypothetical protein
MGAMILFLAIQDDPELSPLPTFKLTLQPTLQFISMRAKADELRGDGTFLPSGYIDSRNYGDVFGTLDSMPELSLQINFHGWGLEAYHADMRHRFDGRLKLPQNYSDHFFPAGPYEFDHLIRRYRAGILAPPWGDSRVQFRLGLGAEVQRLEFGLHREPPDEQVESMDGLMGFLQAGLRVAVAPSVEIGVLLRGGGQPWRTEFPRLGGTGYFFEIEWRLVHHLQRWLSIEAGPRLFVARIDYTGPEAENWASNDNHTISTGFFVALGLFF